MQVTLREARDQFEALVERARRGEEVLIADEGQPSIKLVSVEAPKRQFGTARGKFNLPKDGISR
ncbi:MAG: type II toxin-antitoxin system prevent-host-death family antitoxin [Bryobacteraceae bacterium]|nr:type II toxin-antitoxin system prevent-host-death family antitoxin [Bryobacteraceae bacterium]